MREGSFAGILQPILEGRRIALSLSEGGKSEHRRARRRVTSVWLEIHAGNAAARLFDGKCHREHTAGLRSGKPGCGGKGEKVV